MKVKLRGHAVGDLFKNFGTNYMDTSSQLETNVGNADSQSWKQRVVAAYQKAEEQMVQRGEGEGLNICRRNNSLRNS